MFHHITHFLIQHKIEDRNRSIEDGDQERKRESNTTRKPYEFARKAHQEPHIVENLSLCAG